MKGIATAVRQRSSRSSRSWLSLLFALVLLAGAFPVASATSDAGLPSPVNVNPAQLEYWPLLYGQYDVQAFLESIDSPLKNTTVTVEESGSIPFATALEAIGSQHNIHPRVLLVLLEVASGTVSGNGASRRNLDLSSFAPQQAGTGNEIVLAQLEGAARSLREKLDLRRQLAWQEVGSARYSASSNALADMLAAGSGAQTSGVGQMDLVEEFAAQFETWFGSLLSTPEEVQDTWLTLQKSMPFGRESTADFRGAPHGSGSNFAHLSGVDFGDSYHGQVLNVADGWLLEKNTDWLQTKNTFTDYHGIYASVLIAGTNYVVSYWHLEKFSDYLNNSAIGTFIPRGFPIGTEGTTGWSSGNHIHLELYEGVILPQNVDKMARDTWDGKQLGPSNQEPDQGWVFWADSVNETRTQSIDYEGTAVKVSRATEVKNVGRWSVVELGFPYTSPRNTDDTLFADQYGGSQLSSDRSLTLYCQNGPCPTQPDPVIVAPTQQAVLLAGRNDNPGYPKPGNWIGPIRIQADQQFMQLAAKDFKVKIGGKNAEVKSATKAGAYNLYELRVMPPQQDVNALYDLSVTVNGREMISPLSIRYGDPVGVSYVLTLDTSGSMADPLVGSGGTTKIDEAKATAENFVRLLDSSSDKPESAGLITFATYVDSRYGIPQTATQAHKDTLSAAIRNLTAYGNTALYDAIETAARQFSVNASPTKVVVLLSDGMRTAGSTDLEHAIKTAKDAGVQVCTVRFGQDADVTVLSKIAKETGCVANQSALEPGQLAQAFDAIRLAAAGTQSIGTFTGVLRPGANQVLQFHLDRLTQATFQLIWLPSPLQPEPRFGLLAPDGTRYTSNDLHGAEFLTTPTLRAFRINNPLPGLWKLYVGLGDIIGWPASAASPDEAGIPFEVGVTGDSSLWLRSYAQGPVEAGDLLELGASIVGADPLTGTVTLVTVQRPSGSKVVVPLLDDGLHADGLANDGYYAAPFYDTFEVGTYRLEYNVEGTLPDGTPFTRFARREVQVQGDAGQGILEVPLNEGLNLFALNGLAPTARAPRDALLSITDAYTMVLSYNYTNGGMGFYSDLPDSVNTLKEMDPYQGYWIRTTRPITLQVAGPGLQQNAYIPVHPGWNLLPYLTSASTPITEALSSLAGLYTGVRGYKSGAMSYWPQLPTSMNTLQVMEPNLAYWVAIKNTHTLLDYPFFFGGPPSEAGATAAAQQNLAALNQPQAPAGVTPTERWVDLYSFQVTVNGQPAPIGSVVTVYTPDNRKIGEAVVETTGWVGVLAVYGDSAFSGEVDGARPGDTLSFQINGAPAAASDMSGNPVRWTADGDLLQFRLTGTAGGQNKVFLPLTIRTIQ